MAVSGYPDIYGFIRNLSSVSESETEFLPKTSCSSTDNEYHFQPTLKLSVIEAIPLTIKFYIDFRGPEFYDFLDVFANLYTEEQLEAVCCWTSKPIQIASPNSPTLLDDAGISTLLINLMEDVAGFSSNQHLLPFHVGYLDSSSSELKTLFNLSFLTFCFLFLAKTQTKYSMTCENCLGNIYQDLFCFQSRREALTSLRKIGVPDLEAKWMRPLHLTITCWKPTFQGYPSPQIVPYCIWSQEFWKVQLYCPLTSTKEEWESSSFWPSNDSLLRSILLYHQLEGVIQFEYSSIKDEGSYVKVVMKLDNIRIKNVPLSEEFVYNGMHFPSRIQLCLTPVSQVNVLGTEWHGISYQFPKSEIGFKRACGKTVTTTSEQWKYTECQYMHKGMGSL